ncbi:hypothetical protein RSOLAG22IIIB_12285 [Rhizoctonia solani]|uniref:Uncharacterized protein n=1 Tax=Rhizoctonia solani TaxID=456999 RepID=A0A0K6GCU6_9AGAM|nr:hypothetical protein RSOLAG22IIIB_12285 [Rhizoctonia solani]
MSQAEEFDEQAVQQITENLANEIEREFKEHIGTVDGEPEIDEAFIKKIIKSFEEKSTVPKPGGVGAFASDSTSDLSTSYGIAKLHVGQQTFSATSVGVLSNIPGFSYVRGTLQGRQGYVGRSLPWGYFTVVTSNFKLTSQCIYFSKTPIKEFKKGWGSGRWN